MGRPWSRPSQLFYTTRATGTIVPYRPLTKEDFSRKIFRRKLEVDLSGQGAFYVPGKEKE